MGVQACPPLKPGASPPPCSPALMPTSCHRSPAGPLLRGHRAARAAGRDTDLEAGSCCCAGRGPWGRRSQRCRRRCTPPQGPAPGIARDTGPPPDGTALLSGTPCRLGTGLQGEDRAGLGRGQAGGGGGDGGRLGAGGDKKSGQVSSRHSLSWRQRFVPSEGGWREGQPPAPRGLAG